MKQFIFLLIGITTASAADRPSGRLANGDFYIKDEVYFCLRAAAARALSRADILRQKVDTSRLTALHPAIRAVVGNHLSAERWLNGEPLPAALRHTGPDVPTIARSLTALLAPGEDAAVVVEELREHLDVEWASLNLLHPVDYVPNDNQWTNQWGPARVFATNAWDVPQTSTSVRVAVVDTGVDLTHPDLASRIVYDKGFVLNANGDAKRDARGGASIDHGTHVAGIAAAIRDNNIGIAGIANAGIMAMGCAVWDSYYNQYCIGFAPDAINDAVANNAAVINCSFGMGAPLDPAVSNALNNAEYNGVLVVCAAGNDATNILYSRSAGWAAHGWPIIVSSIQQDDALSPFSNYGDSISIAAPGSGIYSTYTTNYTPPAVDGTYGYMSGTSQASPHVAGAAAMIYAMNTVHLHSLGTRDLLLRMAQDLGAPGRDPGYGFGVLQLPASFLSPLKNANAFVGYNPQPGQADGSYELPYTSIQTAVNVSPPGSTIVLNAGIGGITASYPAQTFSTPVTLAVFPDRPIQIGN